MLDEWPVPTTVCWPALFHCDWMKAHSVLSKRIFIHGECLFLARVPLSHMQIQSCDSHMEWRCDSFLSVWSIGGKEAFSWSETAVIQALHPPQLFCKWIRSRGIILWIPWGQTDTDNCIFYFLCFAYIHVCMYPSDSCVDHLNLSVSPFCAPGLIT